MANKKLKIVLDTNILISFLITRQFDKLDDKILSGKFKLLFSNELFEEFIAVSQRPKFRRFFSKSDVESLLSLLLDYGILIKTFSELKLCRDSEDNFLLNLSLDGEANYLITGDKDLLDLKMIGNAKIITMPDFLSIID